MLLAPSRDRQYELKRYVDDERLLMWLYSIFYERETVYNYC